MALRDRVLAPMMMADELRLRRRRVGSNEEEEERVAVEEAEKEEEEKVAVDAVHGYVTGRRLFLERTTGCRDNGNGGGENKKVAVVVQATMFPVSCRDAPVLASWYNNNQGNQSRKGKSGKGGGDRVLPYTSRTWSDWWIQRCGSPDFGCEMIKLVVVEEEGGEEIIIGVAYFERMVWDRHSTSLVVAEGGWG